MKVVFLFCTGAEVGKENFNMPSGFEFLNIVRKSMKRTSRIVLGLFVCTAMLPCYGKEKKSNEFVRKDYSERKEEVRETKSSKSNGFVRKDYRKKEVIEKENKIETIEKKLRNGGIFFCNDYPYTFSISFKKDGTFVYGLEKRGEMPTAFLSVPEVGTDFTEWGIYGNWYVIDEDLIRLSYLKTTDRIIDTSASWVIRWISDKEFIAQSKNWTRTYKTY